MAENPEQHTPQPEPDNAGGEVVSEEDLDALLSEASALASEIAGDVGDVSMDAPQPGAEDPAVSDAAESELFESSAADNPDDVDSRLAALDRLLEEAGNEVGPPTPLDAVGPPSDDSPGEVDQADQEIADAPAAEDGFPPDAHVSSSPSEEVVPDFMQELTQTNEESSSVPRDGAQDQNDPIPAAPASNPPPGSALPPTARAATLEELKPETSESPKLAEQTQDKAPRVPLKPMQSLMARVGRRLSPVALRVSEKGVDLLEVLNLPLRRFGGRVQGAVGWLAIATIGTSLLVFLVSLF